MKVFMTGGTGNIGQYVLQAFLQAGHSVVLLTRTPDRIPAYRDMPGVTLVKGSLLDFDRAPAGGSGLRGGGAHRPGLGKRSGGYAGE